MIDTGNSGSTAPLVRGTHNAQRRYAHDMSTPSESAPQDGSGQHIVIVGPDGNPISNDLVTNDSAEDAASTSVTDLIEQPAKVMRIGSMIKQLLEEVKSAPLDEDARVRLREIHRRSISELEDGLAPELVEELERLSLPFTEDRVPSQSELRIAQAQLVGWLEGLFHGIQTALFAQQMLAQSQIEQMRQRAIGSGGMNPGQQGQVPEDGGRNSGLYL